MSAGRIFDADLYRFSEAQPSYWEATAGETDLRALPLAGDASCEIAVIGGGYTGLSAAYHLARDFSLDVRVLEAGHIGWGSSGRNAGFCTLGGSKLSLREQIRRFGLDEVRRFHHAQREAVELVRSVAAEEAIDLQAQGDAEYEVASSPDALGEMHREAEVLRGQIGIDARALTGAEFRERCYDSPAHHGALEIRPTFGIHPLRYCLGLAAAAQRRGATLHPRSEVLEWTRDGDRHRLRTAAGTLTAARVILACNGFMPEHLNRSVAGRILPAQSDIIVTRPLTDDELAAHGWRTECVFIEARRVPTYCRLLTDRRLLFGGRGDARGDPASAARVFDGLHRRLGEIWSHWRDVTVDYRWRGLICLTRDQHPAIGRLPDDASVSFAFGYQATGITNGTWAGRALAHWLAGDNSGADQPSHLPVMVRGLPPRFPLPALRRFYLAATLGYYRWRDRF